MKLNLFTILFLFTTVAGASAQSGQPGTLYPPNPMDNISMELTSISKSVKTLNQNMKVFLDKLSGEAGTTKQQKILIGLQILNQAEQRLATLQKSQIELVEKQVPTRARIIQIDQDLRPESVERSATFLGTTKTEEFRDNRKRSLETERASLQTLLVQIESTLAQTSSEVREAQVLVSRLRRQFLPLIEQQLIELQ
jgi:hypothetical protein